MMKKILSIACVLTLLLGFVVVPAKAATKTAYCQRCEKEVTWESVTAFGTVSSGEKHYYLTKNAWNLSQLYAKAGTKVCVDLCGLKLRFTGGRAFYAEGAEISVQDSVGGGIVVTHSKKSGGAFTSNTNNGGGGAVYVANSGENKGIFNLYGGTITMFNRTPDNSRTSTGGVMTIASGSTANIHGGALAGAYISSFGGAVDLQGSGALNLLGGTIMAGRGSKGHCVYVRTANGRVTLGGTANVANIYMNEFSKDVLSVDGAYTGLVNLTYPDTVELAAGTVIGTLKNEGSVTGAEVICNNGSGYDVVADGTDLKLQTLATEAPRYECEHCKQVVSWQALDPKAGTISTPGIYHYYVAENYDNTQTKPIELKRGVSVCLDMNGKQYAADGRCFYGNIGSSLNVMDSQGGGSMTGASASGNPTGGTLYIAGFFNLYSGTLKFIQDGSTPGTGRGGVMTVDTSAIANIYGGKIEGAALADSTYYTGSAYDGVGGAVFVYDMAMFNVQGGEITSGSVPSIGAGPCVYVRTVDNIVQLGGNAKVDDIYFVKNQGENFVVNGNFTGKAGVTLASNLTQTQGTVVGKCDTQNLAGKLTCTNPDLPSLTAVDYDLVLSAFADTSAASIGLQGYPTLQEAVNAAKAGEVVELLTDVTEDVSVTKDTVLQMNGMSVDGTVTVAEGATLYGMDVNTDDYDVADGKYGKITKVEGKVSGVQLEQDLSEDAYVVVKEGDAVSFHRATLEIYAMTLRVNENGEPGLLYKSNFYADQKAAEYIEYYGVALSLVEAPTAENLEEFCGYSQISGFKSGTYANLGNASSTVLTGILKDSRLESTNIRNMSMPVHGRAYVKTLGGEYVFGNTVSRSLADQLKDIDSVIPTLSETQVSAVTKMYNKFSSVLDNVPLPGIKDAVEKAEEGTLKVLVVGNSHGLDATNLLYEVFHNEAPDQKVVIGALYYAGCTVGQHSDYIRDNSKVYDYYKNDGTKANRGWTSVKATCLDALKDEQWDIIIMQQMNRELGNESYFTNTAQPGYWKYVADFLLNNQDNTPTLGFHVVWANPDDYSLYLDDDAPYNLSYVGASYSSLTTWRTVHESLYGGADGKFDSTVMYNKIMQLTQKNLVDSTEFLGKDYFDDRYIMNSATVVQYAVDVLGRPLQEVYRDYTHMNDYGRLLVAYQWYAQLMGLEEITEVKTDLIPANLKYSKSLYPETNENGDCVITKEMKDDIIAAVNWTLEHPFSVTAE